MNVNKSRSAVGQSRLGPRHRQLLAELEAIFLAEGFRNTTVTELCARLKCSKRSLYEIADSKEDLFLAILAQFLDRIRREGMSGMLAHSDPEARILAFLQPGVTETKRATARFVEDIHAFDPARRAMEAHQRGRVETLRDIIEDGVRSGRFRPVNAHFAASVFLAAANLVNEPDVLNASQLGMSDAFASLSDLLLRGLFES